MTEKKSFGEAHHSAISAFHRCFQCVHILKSKFTCFNSCSASCFLDWNIKKKHQIAPPFNRSTDRDLSVFSGQQGTVLWIPLSHAHNGLEKAGENIFCNEPAADVGFAMFNPGLCAKICKNHSTRPRRYTVLGSSWVKHNQCKTCDSYTDELRQNHIWPSGPLLKKGWANLAAANGLPGRRLWPWLRLCWLPWHDSVTEANATGHLCQNSLLNLNPHAVCQHLKQLHFKHA